MGKIDNWRYSTAFSMGRKEHFFSEMLGMILIAVSVFSYFFPDYLNQVYYRWLWFLATSIWCLYYLFHRLEKLFFPKKNRLSKKEN